MRVFVTGATGYIGFHVACAMRRAGHQVWGLARDPDKARRLAQREIRPVIGSLQEPASFMPVAEQASVIVHCAFDYRAEDGFALDRDTAAAFIAAGGARPKTVIYTSGVWVYGDTGSERVDESTPLAPPPLVARRPESENVVLAATGARGVVIRPGCVYGGSGGLTGSWFGVASSGKELRVPGDGRNRWTVIHADDLADLYVRAAARGLSGEIFNATDRSRASVAEMVAAVTSAVGYTGTVRWLPVAEAVSEIGSYAECLALDQHVDSGKAARLLGWEPRFAGFADDAEAYFAAWQSAR